MRYGKGIRGIGDGRGRTLTPEDAIADGRGGWWVDSMGEWSAGDEAADVRGCM